MSLEPSRKHPRATPRARFSHSWFPLGSRSGSQELRTAPTSVFTMKVSQGSCCFCGVLSYSPHTPLDTFGGLRANSSSQILASFRKIQNKLSDSPFPRVESESETRSPGLAGSVDRPCKFGTTSADQMLGTLEGCPTSRPRDSSPRTCGNLG